MPTAAELLAEMERLDRLEKATFAEMLAHPGDQDFRDLHARYDQAASDARFAWADAESARRKGKGQ